MQFTRYHYVNRSQVLGDQGMAEANVFIREREEELKEIMERINARRTEAAHIEQARYEIRLLISRIYSLQDALEKTKRSNTTPKQSEEV